METGGGVREAHRQCGPMKAMAGSLQDVQLEWPFSVVPSWPGLYSPELVSHGVRAILGRDVTMIKSPVCS